MENSIVLLLRKNKFGISLGILMVLKTIFYEWFSYLYLYRTWMRLLSLTLLLICVVCYTFVVSDLFIQIRQKKWGKLLLCVLLLSLPLTNVYESIRFFCLRPFMEKVAVETAQKYRNEKVDYAENQIGVELPFPYSLLARDPEVMLWFDDEAGIRVAFMQHSISPFSHLNAYVYQTNVSYTGPTKNIRPQPNPEFLLVQKRLYYGWKQVTILNRLLLFINPFVYIRYI